MKHTRVVLSIVLGLSFAAGSHAQQAVKYWVMFTHKELPPVMLRKGTVGAEEARAYISERAIQRREKTNPGEPLIDETDLPVNQNYISAVESRGTRIENVVRWFNAVTAYLTPLQCREMQALPFVKKVIPVRSVRRDPDPWENVPARRIGGSSGTTTTLDHGMATAQLRTVNILPLHDVGITGAGVIIGMLDTGFRWKTNDALKNTKVIAEYDFINKDSVTANQPGDAANQDEHGTMTLSTIAGNLHDSTGVYLGAAPDASFILAKTEYVPTEHKVEEDNWAAAIEWMERLGADIASSSLGYSTFDPPDSSYTWANGDFNGRTTITAQAAVMAARKGVLVVNAMGNQGNGNGVIGTLDTPADADSILAVGAIWYSGPDSGSLASFSSTGPTNDGRIKPDVVAPGVSDWVVRPDGILTTGSGTSFATPLTAGAAALIFSGHPDMTAMEVRDALKRTANNALTPDNFYGWGLINAASAFYFDSAVPPPPPAPQHFVLYQNFPNPAPALYGKVTTVQFDIPEPTHATLTVYSVLGQHIRTLLNADLEPRRYQIQWDGRNNRGIVLPSGIYFIVLQTPHYSKTMKTIVVR